MTGILTKGEIIGHLQRDTAAFIEFCSSISDDIFFRQPPSKWSIAQNVLHLLVSANMTRLAFRLPKFVIRAYTGVPNRASRTYDQLVIRYAGKLEEGGKASGKFNVRPVSRDTGKGELLSRFNKSMEKLQSVIDRNWDENTLDKYIAPHPLLGKITLRELGYFTIYHNNHHLAIIRERLND